ncbi:calcium-binding protein [Nostoc sp. XA010]|uniref:M10 family metallopeptidase C-terminal domain-containing protein n=1 Tax=Nostoc sp. XA010 TaxID=2780407 RepID=UPI001E3119C3|nr:calcium-binding protein [Nostoc sp. XA010]MCC5655928.1 calcium-binding protein [Nostoc sp. XA010]
MGNKSTFTTTTENNAAKEFAHLALRGFIIHLRNKPLDEYHEMQFRVSKRVLKLHKIIFIHDYATPIFFRHCQETGLWQKIIFLNGGSGSDTLVGGAGNNTLTGDAGADTFVFNFRSEGIDIIKDFSYLHDKIQISTIGFGATSTNEFSYNRNTGALSFQGTQFATLENKPNFIPRLDIELVSEGLTSSIS